MSFLGPMHTQLNLESTLWQKKSSLIEDLHGYLYAGTRKYLPERPRPRLIQMLVTVTLVAWLQIRKEVLDGLRDRRCAKWPEVSSFVYYLDTEIPLASEHFSVVFKSRNFDLFRKSVGHSAVVFALWRRHNYDKNCLIWLAHVRYWEQHAPEIYKVLTEYFWMIDESFVERFHAILRRLARNVKDVKGLIRAAGQVMNEQASHWRQHYGEKTYPRVRKEKIKELVPKAREWILKKFEKITERNYSVLHYSETAENQYLLPNLFVHRGKKGKQPVPVIATHMAPGYDTEEPPDCSVGCDKCGDDADEHALCRHEETIPILQLHFGHAYCECCHESEKKDGLMYCPYCRPHYEKLEKKNLANAAKAMDECARRAVVEELEDDGYLGEKEYSDEDDEVCAADEPVLNADKTYSRSKVAERALMDAIFANAQKSDTQNYKQEVKEAKNASRTTKPKRKQPDSESDVWSGRTRQK